MRRLACVLTLVVIGTVIGMAAISKDHGALSAWTVAQAPATSVAIEPPAPGSPPDHPGFYAGEAQLTPSERAGREIWYKATAGNARFHTYVFQQRINVLIDWYRVLNAKERGDRFAAWESSMTPDAVCPDRRTARRPRSSR